MNIVEAALTKIRGERVIVFPLKYNDGGGYILDQQDHMILQMRGWGFMQYHPEGPDKAAEMQDSIGEWVVAVLNAAWEKDGVS